MYVSWRELKDIFDNGSFLFYFFKSSLYAHKRKLLESKQKKTIIIWVSVTTLTSDKLALVTKRNAFNLRGRVQRWTHIPTFVKEYEKETEENHKH